MRARLVMTINFIWTVFFFKVVHFVFRLFQTIFLFVLNQPIFFSNQPGLFLANQARPNYTFVDHFQASPFIPLDKSPA